MYTCPRCKGDAEVVYSKESAYYNVICRDCDFAGGSRYSSEDAIESWNKLPRDKEPCGCISDAIQSPLPINTGWLRIDPAEASLNEIALAMMKSLVKNGYNSPAEFVAQKAFSFAEAFVAERDRRSNQELDRDAQSMKELNTDCQGRRSI